MKDVRIGIREIRSLQANETIWDKSVVGFFARRQRSTKVTYGVKYRTVRGEQRWFTIGGHGSPWMPDSARAEARRVLAKVTQGIDPAKDRNNSRHTLSVAEVCVSYLGDIESGRLKTRSGTSKSATTLSTDRSRIHSHIIPLLGSRLVTDVTQDDVEEFMEKVIAGKSARRAKLDKRRALSNVRGGRGAAARTVGLLGAIFTYAVRKRLRNDNPVRGVVRPADGRRDRRLSQEEYRSFGRALATIEMGPHAVAAAKLIVLSGWRLGEIMNLRWGEIDLVRRTARLPNTKTGLSMRPLSHSVVTLLSHQRKVVESVKPNDLVFPGSRRATSMTGFPRMFRKVIAAAGLPREITPHILRHSYASTASELGYSEATIGALLGHRGGGVTRRYIHTADRVLLEAADIIAIDIEASLAGGVDAKSRAA